MFCNMVSDLQCKRLVRTIRAQATLACPYPVLLLGAHAAPTQMVDDDTKVTNHCFGPLIFLYPKGLITPAPIVFTAAAQTRLLCESLTRSLAILDMVRRRIVWVYRLASPPPMR